jgi:hypothetical protein
MILSEYRKLSKPVVIQDFEENFEAQVAKYVPLSRRATTSRYSSKYQLLTREAQLLLSYIRQHIS